MKQEVYTESRKMATYEASKGIATVILPITLVLKVDILFIM